MKQIKRKKKDGIISLFGIVNVSKKENLVYAKRKRILMILVCYWLGTTDLFIIMQKFQ